MNVNKESLDGNYSANLSVSAPLFRHAQGPFRTAVLWHRFFLPCEANNASGKTKWKRRRRRVMRAAAGSLELSADTEVRKNNETRGEQL